MSKKKYKIALIDDKSYWLAQIRNAIPKWVEYNLEYFDKYVDAVWKHFDIIFLDYYLDNDWVVWSDIIGELSADIIIGFSSVFSCSESIVNAWGDFPVQKILSENNVLLNKLFTDIVFK